MIQASRRSFLRGALAVGAASLVVALPFKPVARIVGNGVHDDGPGLNALLRGEPVDIVSDCARIVRAYGIEIRGGLFRSTQALDLVRENTVISNCHFIFDAPETEFGIKFAANRCLVTNNFMETAAFREAANARTMDGVARKLADGDYAIRTISVERKIPVEI